MSPLTVILTIQVGLLWGCRSLALLNLGMFFFVRMPLMVTLN
jgi:hypothetical protein